MISLPKIATRAGALVSALVLSGCGPTYGPELDGQWRLVKSHVTPVADMEPEEARQWVGSNAVFSGTSVRFDDYQCNQAEVIRDWKTASDVLEPYESESTQFGLRDDTPVQVINILCEGQPWMTPGGQLVRMDQERLMIIWRGVFFEFRQSE